jgi:hypothetical protein
MCYDSGTQLASVSDLSGTVEFLVQAVDDIGNVALLLDKSLPFSIATSSQPTLYLPLIRK